jgi:hypothetical protein
VNDNQGTQSLGYADIVSNSPGLQIGLTAFDWQGFGKMERQVEWRSTQMVHFTWTKLQDYSYPGPSVAGYQTWDPDEAELTFNSAGGGCNIHPISIYNMTYHSFLDIDTEGKAIIGAHNYEFGRATTLWYDFLPGNCNFSPYKRRLPDSLMQYGCNTQDIENDFWHFVFPSIAYQVYNGDTVTHVIASQGYGDSVIYATSYLHYFRRVGSDTLGSWDYPPVIVDTTCSYGFIVTASRSTEKVALIWLANPGNYPGDPESVDRFEGDDPGLGTAARFNDVYLMTSNNMGFGWEPKVNLTAYDSSQGGWLAGCDLSALIDSDDYLHIVWIAREAEPLEGALGNWVNFFGSRLYHWDDFHNEIRIVKDANWRYLDVYTVCFGGLFNYQWVVKPMISECEGKFYTAFVQFHDIPGGYNDDCAEVNFIGGDYWNTANGELYLTVSNNRGYNWDAARNLTNTPTPHCFEDEIQGTPVCEADQFPSMSRFGMEVTDPSAFAGAVIIDPSDGVYDGNYYLDIMYLNDKFPGSFFRGEGIWTMNPMKWFRIPCVDPVPNPLLTCIPDSIGLPVWTKPGVQLDTTIRLENNGNTNLNIYSITVVELNESGWMGIGETGPVIVPYTNPNYLDIDVYLNEGGNITTAPHHLKGYIVVDSDADGGSVDSVYVNLIIADTLQFPEQGEIRTECIRLIIDNAGNQGNGGNDNDGGYNMNFFDDCDTTESEIGYDNDADIYLFDASPFIARISGSDTILNYNMGNTNWLTENGFRPIEGLEIDSTTYPDYQYACNPEFLSSDSLIKLKCEYFAPLDPDSCSFIVSKLQLYNNSDYEIQKLFIGDFMDWDIPSDDRVMNGSGCDSERRLIYCYGTEYDPSANDNENCVLSDQRYGGLAFYNGYITPYCGGNDSLIEPRAMWTRLNADYIYPTGGFVAGEIYQLLNAITGYSPWEATYPTMPDSQYQDIHVVSVYGEFDLEPADTLVFVKILASEYNGGLESLQNTIDQAEFWIDSRPDIFEWPAHAGELCGCCENAGDANGNGTVNILDITYLISYLYKGGPAPPCMDEADANESCSINILDITYLISYLYKGGPVPICGCVT